MILEDDELTELEMLWQKHAKKNIDIWSSLRIDPSPHSRSRGNRYFWNIPDSSRLASILRQLQSPYAEVIIKIYEARHGS